MINKTKKHSNLLRIGLSNISIILLIFGIFIKNPYIFLFSSVIILLSNVVFSMVELKDHVIFLLFNFTLFFFLLSRFISTGIFGADFEYNGMFEMSFSDEITINIIMFINLSIVAVSLAYYYFYLSEKGNYDSSNYLINTLKSKIDLIKERVFGSFYRRKRVTKTKSKNKILSYISKNKEKIRTYIAVISFIIFFVSVFVKIYTSFEDAKLISKIGYRESFLRDKTSVPLAKRILDIVGRMYFTSFMIYLSTKPKLKMALIFSILFLIPAVFRLKAGIRNDIMLDTFVLFVYFIFRIENRKVLNNIVISAMIIVPALLLVLMIIEGTRGTLNENPTESNTIVNKILRFFYNQGVSARVIGNAQEYQDMIPNKFYSIGEITDFIKYSILGKIIPGLVEPQGQTYEVFLGKSQLSHVLTFVQSPYEYLNKGLGTGSSFIAELYIDLGIFGIISGSFLYGWFINKLRKMFYSEKTYIVAIMLIMTRNLFFVARSGYSFFLNHLLQETQIMVFIVIFVSAFIFSKIFNTNRKNSNIHE